MVSQGEEECADEAADREPHGDGGVRTHLRAVRARRRADRSDQAMPRTPWGEPDLQGIYTNTFEAGTPLERPDQFKGRNREDVTGEELASLGRDTQDRSVKQFLGPIHAPDDWWQPNLALDNGSQAWFLTGPEDGRIPRSRPRSPSTIRRPGRGRGGSPCRSPWIRCRCPPTECDEGNYGSGIS